MRFHWIIGFAGLLGLCFGLPAGAAAKTVKLPEAKPIAQFEVPDDWAVTPVDGGLELSAPDRTSVVEAGVVRGTRTEITAWQKSATKRMIAFGIAFDPNAKAPPAQASRSPTTAPLGTASPVAPAAGKPAADDKAFGALPMPDDLEAARALPSLTLDRDLSQLNKDADALTPMPNEPAGATQGSTEPSPTTGTTDGKSADPSPPKVASPSKSEPAGSPSTSPSAAVAALSNSAARLRYKSVVIYGASLAGAPMDVEFLNFGANAASSVVMQQASKPSDDRAGAILRSVRPAT